MSDAPSPQSATTLIEPTPLPPASHYLPSYPPSYPPQVGGARHRADGERPGVPVWGWFVLGAAILAMVVIGATVAIAFAYTGGPAAVSLGASPLEKARDACATSNYGVTLEDDGRTLDIDTEGEEESVGATNAELDCILGNLEAPGSVLSKLGNTRAIDGMQTAEWDNYTASWNYHPDHGTNMVISMT